MTQSYVSPATASKLFFNNHSYYVATYGSDVDGADGSVDRPFRTIGKAITTAASGDCILVGPGTYAEQVNVTKSLYISALVPGATQVSIATAAASALTITGTVAGQRLVWEGIDIINTNNAGATSVALTVVGGGVAGNYSILNSKILAGSTTANASTAVNFTGNVGNATLLTIMSPRVMGANLITAAHASDDVVYNNCYFERGPAIWFRITGGVLANVRLNSCVMQGATGTEYIEYGNGAATVTLLNITSSKLNAYLRMNTTGAGYVNIQDSSVSYTTANQLNQIVRYINDCDYYRINLMNIDLDPGAPAAITMFTVPAGRRFNPQRAVTTNRLAATGAALNYRYNGTGAGSVVGAVGAGALPSGSTVEAVTQDSIAPAGTLQFEPTAASTTDTDRGEATVWGRLT